MPPNPDEPAQKAAWIFCQVEQFAWHIDMLRNEKPVHCVVNVNDSDHRGFCSLATSAEPVGEAE